MPLHIIYDLISLFNYLHLFVEVLERNTVLVDLPPRSEVVMFSLLVSLLSLVEGELFCFWFGLLLLTHLYLVSIGEVSVWMWF